MAAGLADHIGTIREWIKMPAVQRNSDTTVESGIWNLDPTGDDRNRKSEPHRRAVLAGVGAADEDAILGVDPDRLIAAEPAARREQAVASAFQRFDHVGKHTRF